MIFNQILTDFSTLIFFIIFNNLIFGRFLLLKCFCLNILTLLILCAPEALRQTLNLFRVIIQRSRICHTSLVFNMKHLILILYLFFQLLNFICVYFFILRNELEFKLQNLNKRLLIF